MTSSNSLSNIFCFQDLGSEKYVYIIAEIGINHNGDMNICKKLIDIAVDSGCDAVKFQKRDIDLVYTKDFLASSRDSPWGKTQRDQKEGLELSLNEYIEIDRYCEEKKYNGLLLLGI